MKAIRQRQLVTFLGALLVAASGNLLASPAFEVTPNSLSGVTSASFNADFMNGVSSARVIFDPSTNSYTSTGYISYGQFSLDGNPVPALFSGLGSEYGLYASFVQQFVCVGGLLGPGVPCSISSVSLGLYADIWNGNPSNINTYLNATLINNPMVIDNGNNDILLGMTESIIAGEAGINALGGAYENLITTLSMTDAGRAFFTNPVPFYDLQFSDFNNTTQGLECDTAGCVNATTMAINSENGGTDFNRIPEPGMLALLGIGLFLLNGAPRRQSSSH